MCTELSGHDHVGHKKEQGVRYAFALLLLIQSNILLVVTVQKTLALFWSWPE